MAHGLLCGLKNVIFESTGWLFYLVFVILRLGHVEYCDEINDCLDIFVFVLGMTK